MTPKKRSCVKGYSCGISCIAVTKACRVSFPDGVSFSLETRRLVLQSELPKGQDPVTEKIRALRSKISEDFFSGNIEKAYDAADELDILLSGTVPTLTGEPPLTPTLRKEASPEFLSKIQTKQYTSRSDNEDLYTELGFNAKPDLVESREDLYNHNGLLQGVDGRPMVLYRGTDKVEYQDDLRTGDKHRVGFGVYGNGTYAAAPDKQSNYIDASYTATSYGSAKIAFGIKTDAKVFRGDMDTEVERIAEKLGLDPSKTDSGIIMGLGGWDVYEGYKASSDQSYYVVLNRGAMVISKENISGI